MSMLPSDVWLRVFPAPRISDVLAYVHATWDWLRATFATAVSFDHDETALTDNLCDALGDEDRRFAHRMDCDFQAETWEFRRGGDGQTTRVARADIRVILGAPGTPHLVLEFKKLDGSSNARWRYCFDGMSRFVEGKYAVGHAFGVMCGFSPHDLAAEASKLAAYIGQHEYARNLCCILNNLGEVVTKPSAIDPIWARFDTSHERPSVVPNDPIILLHALLPCPPSASPPARIPKRKRRSSGP
jgi:hypothetical protein